MSSTKRAASPLEAVREDDSSDSSDDDGPMPMPAAGAAEGGASSGADPGAKRKKRKLAHEKAYLDKLPSAEMYEKSYMHRDVVTHVTVTAATGFIVTASSDGHVKFWNINGRNLTCKRGLLGKKGKYQPLLCIGWAGSSPIVGTADGHLYRFQVNSR